MNETSRNICINLTRRCNLNCPECYVADFLHRTNGKGKMDLTLNEIKEIIDLSTIDGVYLTGGEPLAHPEIREIISYFIQNGKGVQIATNALLLNENMMRFLDHKNISLLVSLREDHKEVYQIVNRASRFDIEIVCYHLPTSTSPALLYEFIHECPSVKNIKLLYNSKNSPTATEWFSLLGKIYKTIAGVSNGINISVEIGFLPKKNKIAQQPGRGAFDRVHVSTEGLFYSCPLLVLNGNGRDKLPPERCTPEKCPIFARNLDDDKYTSVCCFLVTSLETAILIAKWGGIQ